MHLSTSALKRRKSLGPKAILAAAKRREGGKVDRLIQALASARSQYMVDAASMRFTVNTNVVMHDLLSSLDVDAAARAIYESAGQAAETSFRNGLYKT